MFITVLFPLDSTTDDDSIPEERISTPDRDGYNLPRDHILTREQMKLPSRDHSSGGQHKDRIAERRPQNLPSHPTLSDTSSAGSPPAVHRNKHSYDMTDIPDLPPMRSCTLSILFQWLFSLYSDNEPTKEPKELLKQNMFAGESMFLDCNLSDIS